MHDRTSLPRTTLVAASVVLLAASASAQSGRGGEAPADDRSAMREDSAPPPGGPGDDRDVPGGRSGPRLPPPRFAPASGPPLAPPVLEALGLDDAQWERVDALSTAMRREMRALHREIEAQHQALAGLWREDPPDAARIDAAIDQLGALRTRAEKREAAFRVAVMAVLTSEQRTKLREMEPDRRGPGHRPPPPDRE